MRPDRVVLAHGWLAGPRQVAPLARSIADAGFEVTSIAYPSLFGSFDRAVDIARRAVPVEPGRRVHLVGFSLGGLVMRAVAAEDSPNVASLLLIGTPNAGSSLADLIAPFFPTSTVRRMRSEAGDLPQPPTSLTVGCIAGDGRGIIGRLIAGPNDSRVSVASALAIRHDVVRIVPCKHRMLHSHPATCRHAVAFLQTGRFAE